MNLKGSGGRIKNQETKIQGNLSVDFNEKFFS